VSQTAPSSTFISEQIIHQQSTSSTENQHQPLCGALETDHLFFKCVLSRLIWASFVEALGWERAQDSLQDILDKWTPLGRADYKFKIFVLGVVLWAIWVTRNKIAIGGWRQNLLLMCCTKFTPFCRDGARCWGRVVRRKSMTCAGVDDEQRVRLAGG
jgi:hypothetical protein